ncbi:beta-ketoacyl synthase N-terminal-like domain-containing protein [Actinocrispum sp. NPDC049592]|uniref:beta-ketoacyl synthase N-terminal-like domain-containing protein n=1 Tax=Actinocrispum sp. NPDC049592 TaxID=3154835 RepID=UPI00343DDFDE
MTLVISGWSALCPYGAGRAGFADGILTGRSGIGELDQDSYPGPYRLAGLVPDFSAAGALGRKGTRTMDRVTALAVTAAGQLIEDAGAALTERPEQVGVVLGTGSGSVQSIMDFTRDSLAGDKPYHVDPARFPNTVMNRAAGQIAIWHGIKGPNTTIAGSSLTGLLALNYAIRLLRGGHCEQVLCGAAEEYSVQRAWLEWHAREDPSPLGEGASLVLLETLDTARRAGRTPLATVLGTRFMAFQDTADAGPVLARCVQAVLEQAGVPAGDVRVVAPLGCEGELGAAEESGIAEALGGTGQKWVRTRSLIGDLSAAATSLQLAATLAMLESDSTGPALITGVDRDGTVGCCLLGVTR